MREKSIRKWFISIVCSLAMVAGLLFVGFGAPMNGASSAAVTTSGAPSKDGLKVHGEAWKTYTVIGNLPASAPDVKDDIYTHYNYRYISENQDKAIIRYEEHGFEFTERVLSAIKEGKGKGHGFNQLKLFYDMISDTDSFFGRDITDIKPYLDRIEAVASIEDLNKLLISKDFPFTPFINTCLTSIDTRKGNTISLYPNLLSIDYETYGVGPLLDTDNEDKRISNEAYFSVRLEEIKTLLSNMGKDEKEAEKRAESFCEFEKSYMGKLETSELSEYGDTADGEKANNITPDEMYKLCPNFPLKDFLAKQGRDHCEIYNVADIDWLKALNRVWIPENLTTLKEMVEAYFLLDTGSFWRKAENKPKDNAPNPYRAYYACDNNNTFDHILGELFVDNYIGREGIDRLNNIAKKYIGYYKDLINKTPWLGEDSKAAALLKLDNITINILKPERGYIDYEDLSLVPASAGGSVFSNYMILRKYRLEQENKLIGKVGKDTIWFNTKPSENNCFYDHNCNSINIMPGFTTSLLYDKSMSDEELLGTMGDTLGHEISHAFDFYFSQFDAYGMPNSVFTQKDVEEYVTRTKKVEDYYKSIKYISEVGVETAAYKSEAVADILGTQATFSILKEYKEPDYEKFFRSLYGVYADVWESEEELKNVVLFDGHPPDFIRYNVSVQMDDTIYDVFGIKEGDGMYLAPEERIYIFGPKS